MDVRDLTDDDMTELLELWESTCKRGQLYIHTFGDWAQDFHDYCELPYEDKVAIKLNQRDRLTDADIEVLVTLTRYWNADNRTKHMPHRRFRQWVEALHEWSERET